MKKHLPQRGFTLIELLVVISIIAMLSSIVFAALTTARSKARIAGIQQFDSSVLSTIGVDALGVWNFEEGSGNTMSNAMGPAAIPPHPSPSAKPSWTTDTPSSVSKSALRFFGMQYIPVTTLPPGSPTCDWTISAWFKPTSLPQDGLVVVYGEPGDSGSPTGYSFGIGNGSGGAGSNLVGYAQGVQWLNTNVQLTVNTWYHVLMTCSAGVTSFYVDGKELSYHPTPIYTAPSKLNIGGGDTYFGAQYKFIGIIDNVRVYHKSVKQQ